MEVIGSRHGPITAQKFTDYEKKVLGNAHKDITKPELKRNQEHRRSYSSQQWQRKRQRDQPGKG
jgi:hypothetical protein